MALPPTIPTSFTPHPAASAAHRPYSDFAGAFGFFGYAVLGVVFIAALGVFLYGRILASDVASKDAELAKAEASIDPATISGFVRLRDRLNSSQTLLASHVAPTGFFAALEALLPVNVRFTSLHIAVDSTGVPRVDGLGVAKSFNALAAASGSFAADGRIKDAIFSKMTINKDSSVSFGFSASLDPKTVAFSPDAVPTGTASSSTPPTTSAAASTTPPL
ncbi:MAG: hypothetical protein ACYC1Y_00475 [Minisyncoccota bacterium]